MKISICFFILMFCFHSLAATTELKLGPDDPVVPSLLQIVDVRHQVRLMSQSLIVTTTWRLRKNSSPPDAILLGSFAHSKRVSRVRVDGVASPFTVGQDGILRIGLSHWPKKLEVDYELLDANFDRLFEVSSLEFFAILPLISSAQGDGFDTRPTAGSNFSDSLLTTAEVRGSEALLVYGSGPAKKLSDSVRILPRRVGRFVLGFANPSTYRSASFSSAGTRFLILSPRGPSGFRAELVRNIIRRSWPVYRARFPNPSDSIVLHDDSAMPVGAGPTGSNVFGFGDENTVPPEMQQFLLDQAGWPKMKSSVGYITYLLPSSQNPVRDYWTTIVNHELGHLFFGFGITTERHPLLHEYWMSLGLGLAVDEQITETMTGQPPEFYDGLVAFWKDRLSQLPIDQRLENPDLSADSANKVSSFNRNQHFAHGKSLYFWRRIRRELGDELFNRLVDDYVTGGGSVDGYLGFRPKLLKALPTLPSIERKFRSFSLRHSSPAIVNDRRPSSRPHSRARLPGCSLHNVSLIKTICSTNRSRMGS